MVHDDRDGAHHDRHDARPSQLGASRHAFDTYLRRLTDARTVSAKLLGLFTSMEIVQGYGRTEHAGLLTAFLRTIS